MKDTKYFSTARPGTKRGGGAAVTARGNRFYVSKLNIESPKPLEIVWALLRPKVILGDVSKIIICSFYSPPNSKKKSALIDHMAININKLKIMHPKAFFIIAGDKNDLNESEILSISPAFRQIVLKPTRKNKTLTVVITDLHRFFQEPFIIPPVPVDDGAAGVPSDHLGVLVLPLNNNSTKLRTKKTITVRPIKDSALEKFGQTIVQETWSFLQQPMGPTELVEEFQNFSSTLVDHFFPLKNVLVSSYDQPFFNDRLRLLRRQRQRIYRKEGRSIKYTEVKTAFNNAFKQEAHQYKDKIIAEVSEGKRGSAYKALKKLGSGNPEVEDSFNIPSHLESNLSPSESAEILANYFSAISQEFEAIDEKNFTPDLREKLATADNNDVPILEEHIVYKKILSAKKPNSSVPGDLPKKIVTPFAVELAKPAKLIYNAVTQAGVYPRQWIIEYQMPIPKLHPPTCEDDLRNISGTPFFSKVYESFLSDWLMPIVQPFLDLPTVEA
jgi:hypothetical protein